jgi:hypothetical protein
MLNARLYRAALAPFVLALAIAAFSLQGRPPVLSSTLAPEAFQGQQAFAEMRELTRLFPSRRAGSAADGELAQRVAGTIRGLGGTAGGGFAVRTEHFEGQTIDGARELSLLIAERPGSSSASPIVIVAHRDAAAPRSEAEMSATATLLELARVFSERETKRTMILVSTSGGSGGGAGAARLAEVLPRPVDAAIVIGDLADAHPRRPSVIAYSDGFGSGSLTLARTLEGSIEQQTGADPGAPSALGQVAHLALPLAPGEEGALNAAGVPAALVQSSGEAGPAPAEPVSAEALGAMGRAVLSTVDALDGAPDLAQATQTGVVLQRKVLPEWAVSLLVAAGLLGPLLVATDGLARARRRGLRPGRWVLWALSCALPFLCCALLVYLLSVLGILQGTPPLPVPGRDLSIGAAGVGVVVAVVLTFLLAWLLWGMLLQRLGWDSRPDAELAGLAVVTIVIPLALLVWVQDPYTALLLVPAAHIWLLLASPELRPRRAGAAALVAAGLAPLALIVAFYMHQLGLGAGAAAWTAVGLVAGGHVGPAGALLWSVALGAAAAAVLVAVRGSESLPAVLGDGSPSLSTRGPVSYAGPGSLGGTESALRR